MPHAIPRDETLTLQIFGLHHIGLFPVSFLLEKTDYVSSRIIHWVGWWRGLQCQKEGRSIEAAQGYCIRRVHDRNQSSMAA